MTSVPKPLKFLHPHYPELQKLFETWPQSENKVCIHNTISGLPDIVLESLCRYSLSTRDDLL